MKSTFRSVLYRALPAAILAAPLSVSGPAMAHAPSAPSALCDAASMQLVVGSEATVVGKRTMRLAQVGLTASAAGSSGTIAVQPVSRTVPATSVSAMPVRRERMRGVIAFRLPFDA